MISVLSCRGAVLSLLWLAGREAVAQESLLPPAPELLTTTWFYWALPLLATMVALTVGLRIHRDRVRATIASWPHADTSFSALCGRALTSAVISFAGVMAIFAWVAFSARTGDEWILHRTVAMSSVGVGVLVCSIPWLLARSRWTR